MTIRLPLIGVFAGALALGACVKTFPDDAACNPVPAHGFIGEAATPANVEGARVAAGATTVRTVAPGDAVTMDYVEGRLNVDVSRDGIILDLRCG